MAQTPPGRSRDCLTAESASEVETDFSAECARRDIVGSTECGNEVVERFLVRQIDDREAETPLVAVAVVKEVVLANREVEQVARQDAWRVVVVIFGPGGRDLDKFRAVLCCWAKIDSQRGTERSGGSSSDTVADEPGLELLVGADNGSVYDGIAAVWSVVAISSRARHRSCNQSAVITPVESDPGAAFPGLVLKMRGLFKILIVVNAENCPRRSRRGASPANLRIKEAGGDVGENDKSG